MSEICKAKGGGEKACAGARWSLQFAKSIRGTGTCAPGSTMDPSLGYCVEGNDVFGPFNKQLVADCKARGGGDATCETMRWNKSMVPPAPNQEGDDNVLDVPYFWQYHNANEPGSTCGLTSAAMLLNYWGVKVTPDSLYKQYGKKQGQAAEYLAQIYKWKLGYGVYTLNGSIDLIKKHIDAGRPVIIHGYFTGSGHIMLVRGYDDSGLIVNDPAGEWAGCYKCGYPNKTSTNGKGAHYSYQEIRSAAGGEGEIWMSVGSKTPFSL